MGISDRDTSLGMDRPITRRDFLNGVALAVGAAAIPGSARGASPSYDPAAQTGLRGHGEPAMQTLHAVRDGAFWESAPPIEPTGEHYDLVIVGAGISGLAAAYLFRQQKPDASILILEGNDDVGGHAARNEFIASNGRRLIGYGGSQSLQSPSLFSPLVTRVMEEIGVDVAGFETYYDQSFWEPYWDAAFFRAEDFGIDALVAVTESAAEWVPQTPLNEQAKADLIELIDAPRNYLPGRTREEKMAALGSVSYAEFLTATCRYDPQLLLYFRNDTEEYLGVGIDAATALDAWGLGLPGFDGMDLGEVPHKAMSPSARLMKVDPDEYIHHFPDGNAGVARALLRALIPSALPGTTMEDLVVNAIDYAQLDRPESPVRIRLNAPVVRVKHEGGDRVAVTYLEDGRLRTASAGNTVLACWHRVIPHITDELPPAQVEALNDQVKVPLVYANVLIREWTAFDTLGVAGFKAPGAFFRAAFIDDPVSIGSYRFPSSPGDPMLLHFWSVPVPGEGASARDQATAGRYLLTTLTFEDMEREIRDLLQRALGAGGFDAARDIEAITINRWSHGYSLEYMRPWDQVWPDEPLPIEAARKGWGRIAIANADSGAYAYAHSAIDQAARAVDELLGGGVITGFATFPGPPLGPDELVG